MKKILNLIVALMVVGLSACGGGGPAATSMVLVPTSAYAACGMGTSAAAAAHTTAYTATYEPLFAFSGLNTQTVEKWTMQIDGQSYDLNVVISKPPVATAIRGIVVNVHGFSAANATLPPTAMTTTVWDGQMNQRGYLSVSVALRGNFGSTGAG